MKKTVDLFLVYKFIKQLATPFDKWNAFKTGVIDENGSILKPKEKRNEKENSSFTTFDLLVLKLKKILGKLPGGKTKLASYMAAMWLIKEHTVFNSGILNEEMIDLNEFEIFYLKNLSEEPTVSVGTGNIAGLGVGPQGEPGLSLAQQIRYTKRNKSKQPRKILADKEMLP